MREQTLTDRAASEFSLHLPAVLLILAYGASLHLIGLGSVRALTYHEVLLAQPAKEMVTTGDWIIPKSAGIPSNHKPPLTHWLIAAGMMVFNSTSEWVVRFPSVVAALLAALMVAALAARWFGRRAGLIAGLIQLTAVYVLITARLADADMPLLAAVSTAMWAFAVANVDSSVGRRTDRWLPWVFYLAIGVAFLAKGPIGPVFVLAPCLLWVITHRDWRGVRFLADPTGLLIGTILLLSWPVAAYTVYRPILDDWIFHNWGRFRGELAGHKPLLFYFYSIPWLILPWTPFAAVGAITTLRQRERARTILGFLGFWCVAGVTLITASVYKHWIYVLPLLPPFSVLAACGLVHYLTWPYATTRAWRSAMAACVVLGGLGGLLAVHALLKPEIATRASLVILIAAAGLSIPLFFQGRHRSTVQLTALFATLWLVGVLVQTHVIAKHDSWRPQADLATRANRRVPTDEALYLVELPENQITYYLTPSLIRIDDIERFEERLQHQSLDEVYILAPAFITDRLMAYGEVEIVDRCPTLRKYTTERDRLTLMRLLKSPTSKVQGR